MHTSTGPQPVSQPAPSETSSPLYTPGTQQFNTSCSDWIVNFSSTTHFARDRSSFDDDDDDDYVPLNVALTPYNITIVGIGTVTLGVTRDPMWFQSGRIQLKGVLHIPTAICNGVATLNSKENLPVQNLQNGAEIVTFHMETMSKPLAHAQSFRGLYRLLAARDHGQSYLAGSEE